MRQTFDKSFEIAMCQLRGPAGREALWVGNEPIRAELFGADRLEAHARSLAKAQTVASTSQAGQPLADRLLANGAVLLDVYTVMAQAIKEGRPTTPAAEWLIDNYHLVEKQIREIRSDLPPGYYRQLPKLAGGPLAGFPRVFGLAWAFVAHTDSAFEPELLSRFVRAYQTVQPLTIGELWAVSITLRIVLIENLRRLAGQIKDNRAARQEADSMADRLLDADGHTPEVLASIAARYRSAAIPEAFAVQMVYRLRDQDPRVTPALTWLEDRMIGQGTTSETAVNDVHRRQGASNVSVRNIITSLRLIADADWNDLVEDVSLVDKLFAADSDFAAMDFATRNLYRNAVEEIARGSGLTELAVARAACVPRPEAAPDDDAIDPGHRLIGCGRAAFEMETGFRPTLRQWPPRIYRRLGIFGYAGAIVALAVLILALPLWVAAGLGVGSPALWALALCGLVPALDVAVAMVNCVITNSFRATQLPAMALRDGIPAAFRTMIVMPVLLTAESEVAELVERLEIHHLSSPDGALQFALLSDWTDASAERVARDEVLLATATAAIAALNLHYPADGGQPRFLLLHRRRIWSRSEGCWMGWERKRGKLHELNRLLRGATDTSYMVDGNGAAGIAPDTRFVITLDADTRLPRDTVCRLIGKLAHPLNRPQIDQRTGAIAAGYAILQPRVTPSLPVGREGSEFQRIFSSMAGLDPYAAAVSDVYQDLFGEGSYAGKGIYDVDAFEAALAGRVPDATLLSHDLFEGIFARSGLVSDVEVVEEFPARYDVAALRQHRWARGDWQLLPWITGLAHTPAGRTPLQATGHAKMVDNLRRTLSTPAMVAALFVGWLMPLPVAVLWTAFILATILLPALLPVLIAVPFPRPEITFASHARALRSDLRMALKVSALMIIFAAHQAWMMTDAIMRSLWRMTVSRRHLLEWTPAAATRLGPEPDVRGYYRFMAGAMVIALGAVAVALSGEPAMLALVAPFALLWALSPALARRVSRAPPANGQVPLADADTRLLRRTARRTWRYFETFVTTADSMLPPDNFQETPLAVIAHRTSPTNLGLYLLSVVSARDLGWIGTAEAADRLTATLATMQRLARHRGHFYNWYDTCDLRPLDPPYVSTVDSGNLAGHLIALANACAQWRKEDKERPHNLAGVLDAIELASDAAAQIATTTPGLQQLVHSLAALAAMTVTRAESGTTPAQRLALVAEAAKAVTAKVQALSPDPGDPALSPDPGDSALADLRFWINAIKCSVESLQRDAAAAALPLIAIEASSRTMAMAMQFGFLLDPQRKLLSIGYLVNDARLDPSCYDLLASEARLASFFAIAKGDIPSTHWFRLGRSVAPVATSAALVSWSGSMFEYLMPALVMRAPAGSLLARTAELIVRRQIDYAASRGVPWGISESAYNVRDIEFTYQYSNFGVPGLGLKRGLADDLVIAPYATALAAMVDPRAACANLDDLEQVGGRGRYGFYEALDFTPRRIPAGQRVAVVSAYMAHHQGMTIVAIADALGGGMMRRRFHAEPIIRATELLLQERPPREVAVFHPWAADVKTTAKDRDSEAAGWRYFSSADQQTPSTQLLSNGRFTTMLTAAGSGYSRWGDFAINRWREDATCDDHGSYVFVRDIGSDRMWSIGQQPCGGTPDLYAVTFQEDHVEFTRRDGAITTTLHIMVSAEDDAEVRHVTLVNSGKGAAVLDVTTYAELALARQADDVAHPAFSKLFVQTEYLPELGAIVATRRRRSPTDPELWVAHFSCADDSALGPPGFETDRARFVGRGNTLRSADALAGNARLSGTAGTVLDPVLALRRRVRIAPGATVRIAFWTVVAASRDTLLDAIDAHCDATAFHRARTLAWTQAQVQLHHIGITAVGAGRYQRLAGHLIYAAPTLRPTSETISQGAAAQSGLWGLAISGDLPILLVRISDIEHIGIVRDLLKAIEYWRMKLLEVDLVILNERQSSYVQDLQTAIETLVRISRSRVQASHGGRAGTIFTLRADLIPPATRAQLLAVARVVLVAQRGNLADQLVRIAETAAVVPASAPLLRIATAVPQPVLPELEFFNGLGGFANNGRDYVILLGPGQSTPAPWINVISNPLFGFQVAAEGGGYSWSVNSRENQLTPWSNDPVCDRLGEVFYLRDEDSGAVWTPTAAPIRDPAGHYVARHGRGYSSFEHRAHDIGTRLHQFVPVDDPVKLSRLALTNHGDRPRRISVTAYVEWVLGASRAASAPFIITEIDAATGAMFARNPWSRSFGHRVAFIDWLEKQSDWTGDRREFIGRNGDLAHPAGVFSGEPLSGQVGAGLDPCGAMRTQLVLPPGASVELIFLLGEAETGDAARALVKKYRSIDPDDIEAAVASQWDRILGQIAVRTPDRATDIMLNGWLLYQALACRVWARSGFYQASGAYGFRDQLQDGLALVAAVPEETRAHLLRAAARQFVQGDVQHWWQPHSGEGVRTRISDDRVWLAYAVDHYVTATGDAAVLDVEIPFLEGQMLGHDESENFFQPSPSEATATLYVHVARALDISLAVGAHGLPLIGTGDWNDGMNRVGAGGAGESVWLGWLLVTALRAFVPVAVARGDTAHATAWAAHATSLASALEAQGWDGAWYRRGYFDDGSPLGAAANAECRIDSIAQSWAVLSGAGDPWRAATAMDAVQRKLIRPDDGLAVLFTPPFAVSSPDPGYIMGYPPGLRENGGQYTHAALWSVMAFAALGQGNRAGALFSMLNPINHARTPDELARYKVEPYVVAADIYAAPAHVGRGGWTWYTGSAAWMQRAGIESILGMRVVHGVLHINPCIPAAWPGFEVTLAHGASRYTIVVDNAAAVQGNIVSASVDGVAITVRPVQISLQDDGRLDHRIDIRLG